jgi:hypothetical protein
MPGPAPRLTNERLALLPAAAHVDLSSCHAAIAEGGSRLLELILAKDLGPLWHDRLQSNGLLRSLPSATIEALRGAHIAAAMGYLAQRAALDRLDRLFESEGIPYVAIKGAHVRECVYSDPALRPASDIDILISPSDRRRAARALLDAGYSVHPALANVSHEATFSHHSVDIDLHWNMLRPGRTRVDLTESLIDRRQRTNRLWGLSDSDTLFLMLTHPAFAKYVCSPNMGLVRVADFLLWINRRPVDWPGVLQLLDRAGLKTAAWTMLTWFRMLVPDETRPTIDGWIDTLRPDRLRAAYLAAWLARDLPGLWIGHPLLIQVGFTLPLHDRPGDALRALIGLYRSRRNRLSDVRRLLGDDLLPADRHRHGRTDA